jgi:predicted nucleic acid-binding OB-fold protein
MPDSDASGEKYKKQIIDSLEKRAIPCCVVTFDGFKDVSEYLDSGHTGKELAQRITDEVTKIDGHGGVTYPETPTYPDIDI